MNATKIKRAAYALDSLQWGVVKNPAEDITSENERVVLEFRGIRLKRVVRRRRERLQAIVV